jgi:hypothetical protein
MQIPTEYIVFAGLLMIMGMLYTMNQNINNNLYMLSKRIDKDMESMKADINSLFQGMESFHNFGSDRVKVCSLLSYKYSCRSVSSTAFAVHYKGYVADVTVSHIHGGDTCGLIACEGLDIALIPVCPREYALNASAGARMEGGDTVISCGFSDFVSSYQGQIGGKFGRNEISFPPFVDKSNIPYDAHVISGATQAQGMSGGLVLNGYGALGIAVARGLIDKGEESLAFVIPIYYIQQCIWNHRSELFTSETCPVEILNPPVLLSKSSRT